MQITVSGHHIEVTTALRQYIHDKFDRIERHCDLANNVQVIISVEKLVQKAEATIHLAGNNVFAEATHDDMYVAIDALVDKLDRQIKKHKEKQVDKNRQEKVRDYSA